MSDTITLEQAASDQANKLMLTETLGSVLWFVMDGLWMLNLATPAKLMVLPTLAVNLFVFRFTKASFSQISVVAAMNSWLVMNICWMIGDLDKNPEPIAVARLMFGLGIAFLVLAVGRNIIRPDGLATVLARFRRLRM